MPRTIPGTALGGTDMTTTVTTEEGQVFIFVAVDHCTAECIGIHTAKSGDRFERWSRSGRASASTSAASTGGSPLGWRSATTTAALT